jgi:hypothetical protein
LAWDQACGHVGELSAGYLVLEDLAPRVALDHLIRHDGAAAHPELLTVFARARRELSAATAGQAGITIRGASPWDPGPGSGHEG